MKKTFIILIIFSFSILGYGCTTKKNSDTLKMKNDETSLNSTVDDRPKLSKEYLLGSWQSPEEDWPMELMISKNLKTEQLELEILSPEEMKGTYKTASGYSSYSNEDNSVRYKFSLNGNQLYMQKVFTSNEPNTVGMVRPWRLDRVNE